MEHLRKPSNDMALRLVRSARDVVFKERGVLEDNVVLCPFSFLTGVAAVFYHAAGTNCRDIMERFLGFQELFAGHGKPEDVLMAFREALKYLSQDKSGHNPRPSQANTASPEFRERFSRPFVAHFLHKILLHPSLQTDPTFLCNIKKYLHVEYERVDLGRLTPEELVQRLQSSLAGGEHALDTEVPPEMIDPTYTGLRTFLANAAYYTGNWQASFDRRLTYTGRFYTETGLSVEAQFMTMTHQFAYYEDPHKECHLLELPYFQNSASLVLVLPLDFGRHGDSSGYSKKMIHTPVTDLTRFLKVEDYRDFNMLKRMRTVKLAIPKFFIQSTFGIAALLEEFGCQSALGDDAGYEYLSTDKADVRVGEGFHKAAIEIDEDGTFVVKDPGLELSSPPEPIRAGVAGFAACKAHDYGPKLSEREKKDKQEVLHIVFDRPFLFDVRHNRSGLFVFNGFVACP